MDCLESVETSNTAEWLTLKLECENQTDCSYFFMSSVFVDSCAPTEIVDYLHVYYTCQPGGCKFTTYVSQIHCKCKLSK